MYVCLPEAMPGGAVGLAFSCVLTAQGMRTRTLTKTISRIFMDSPGHSAMVSLEKEVSTSAAFASFKSNFRRYITSRHDTRTHDRASPVSLKDPE